MRARVPRAIQQRVTKDTGNMQPGSREPETCWVLVVNGIAFGGVIVALDSHAGADRRRPSVRSRKCLSGAHLCQTNGDSLTREYEWQVSPHELSNT
jgi:hypothetical protein